MNSKAKAYIHLKFSNSKLLVATVAALKPEVDSPTTHRSNVNLQVHDCFLVLNIHAEDTVALRAMVNTYLRWITSTLNIIEVIEHI
jgi:tRNA threonylcarbamoyladenosine modification (KEOPS) complex  Pcc1 subunit